MNRVLIYVVISIHDKILSARYFVFTVVWAFGVANRETYLPFTDCAKTGRWFIHVLRYCSFCSGHSIITAQDLRPVSSTRRFTDSLSLSVVSSGLRIISIRSNFLRKWQRSTPASCFWFCRWTPDAAFTVRRRSSGQPWTTDRWTSGPGRARGAAVHLKA